MLRGTSAYHLNIEKPLSIFMGKHERKNHTITDSHARPQPIMNLNWMLIEMVIHCKISKIRAFVTQNTQLQTLIIALVENPFICSGIVMLPVSDKSREKWISIQFSFWKAIWSSAFAVGELVWYLPKSVEMENWAEACFIIWNSFINVSTPDYLLRKETTFRWKFSIPSQIISETSENCSFMFLQRNMS